MEQRYPVPAGPARAELLVLNSRFIATASPAASVEAAKALVAAARAAMPGASHHCFAYLIGYGTSVTAGMSDDGEPAGTAGRPMLAVLRGADLGDVAVVVTRFFGGTLLGSGGLVRAYSDAAKAVLEQLPRTAYVTLQLLVVRISYASYAAARRALEAAGALIEGETFAADVRVAAQVPADRYAATVMALSEATAGQAVVEPQESS